VCGGESSDFAVNIGACLVILGGRVANRRMQARQAGFLFLFPLQSRLGLVLSCQAGGLPARRGGGFPAFAVNRKLVLSV
jgi:hypothetical protein